jgi:hypothetical protein
MIETLLKDLKGLIGSEILEKTDAKPVQMEGILSVIGDVTKSEVKNQMLGGGLSNVMNLFSEKKNNSVADSIQGSITNGIISGLIQKIGLSNSTAKLISNIAVPVLMQIISKKNSATPDNDASPLVELFGDIKKGGLSDIF